MRTEFLACALLALACLPATWPLLKSAFLEAARRAHLFRYDVCHRTLTFRQARPFLIRLSGVGILAVVWLAWGALGDASPAGEFMRSLALVSIVYIVMGTTGTLREIKARLDGIDEGLSARRLIDDEDDEDE